MDVSTDFDVSKYMGHWYTIQTEPISYQPAGCDCLTATYTLVSPTKVQVNNQCQYVTGDKKGQTSGGILNAVINDPSVPAKLDVGPTFLPSFLYGDYWVLEHAEDYSWAIISGGKLTSGLYYIFT